MEFKKPSVLLIVVICDIFYGLSTSDLQEAHGFDTGWQQDQTCRGQHRSNLLAMLSRHDLSQVSNTSRTSRTESCSVQVYNLCLAPRLGPAVNLCRRKRPGNTTSAPTTASSSACVRVGKYVLEKVVAFQVFQEYIICLVAIRYSRITTTPRPPLRRLAVISNPERFVLSISNGTSDRV